MTNDANHVLQLRVIIEASDFDEALAFYRDVLGMPEWAAFAIGGDDRVAILDAGRATLELATPTHKAAIDEVETKGGASEAKVRPAFEVADSAAVTEDLVEGGATLVSAPVLTPWMSLNSRVNAPADQQITIFQETETLEQRSRREGFAADSNRSTD